jgi:hypothetical protein
MWSSQIELVKWKLVIENLLVYICTQKPHWTLYYVMFLMTFLLIATKLVNKSQTNLYQIYHGCVCSKNNFQLFISEKCIGLKYYVNKTLWLYIWFLQIFFLLLSIVKKWICFCEWFKFTFEETNGPELLVQQIPISCCDMMTHLCGLYNRSMSFRNHYKLENNVNGSFQDIITTLKDRKSTLGPSKYCPVSSEIPDQA